MAHPMVDPRIPTTPRGSIDQNVTFCDPERTQISFDGLLRHECRSIPDQRSLIHSAELYGTRGESTALQVGDLSAAGLRQVVGLDADHVARSVKPFSGVRSRRAVTRDTAGPSDPWGDWQRASSR